MEDFIEVPASKHSLIMRRPIYGIANNDAPYVVSYKGAACPYYIKWKNMLRRCYSKGHTNLFPTYTGCSVCTEWLTFTKFKAWMEKKDWQDKDLDKDLLVSGNKIYSPESCCFVSKKINYILLASDATRGEYPQGVSWCRMTSKYRARVRKKGKQEVIGYYSDISQAEIAYCLAKSELLELVAHENEAASEPKIQAALLREAKVFSDRAEVLDKQRKEVIL